MINTSESAALSLNESNLGTCEAEILSLTLTTKLINRVHTVVLHEQRLGNLD